MKFLGYFGILAGIILAWILTKTFVAEGLPWFLLGLLPLLIPAIGWMLVLSPAVFLINGLRKDGKKILMRRVFVIVFTILLIPHVWMSYKLTSMKNQFDKVAYEVNPGIEWHPEGGGRYNYGGRLNEICRERDELLNSYGFGRLGRWSVGADQWPTQTMAYFWLPPFLR